MLFVSERELGKSFDHSDALLTSPTPSTLVAVETQVSSSVHHNLSAIVYIRVISQFPYTCDAFPSSKSRHKVKSHSSQRQAYINSMTDASMFDICSFPLILVKIVKPFCHSISQFLAIVDKISFC